jgi:hemolysin activation/secretion protein
VFHSIKYGVVYFLAFIHWVGFLKKYNLHNSRQKLLWVLGSNSFALSILIGVQLIWFPNQVIAQIPSAGESGVIEKSIRDSRPRYKPPVQEKIPDITIEDNRKLKDGGAGPSFFVRKILIRGNTLIDDEDLASLVELNGGTEMTLGILGLYANEITGFYNSKGYILTRAYVPAQEIKDGIVVIKVSEGRIGKIRTLKTKRVASKDILKRIWRVKEGEVLKESDLERSLLELNDVLGIDSKSILKPGSFPGSSDLMIQIEESLPVAFSFDADNFGSTFTGRIRYGVSASIGNLLTFSDQFSVRAVRSNLGQNFIKPSYLFPVNRFGTTLDLSFTFSEHTLGGNLIPLEAGGKAWIYAAQLGHPILRSRKNRLDVFAGYEVRKFKNFQLGFISSWDELHDFVVGVRGDFTDFLNAKTYVDLRFRQGTTEGDSTRPLNSRFMGFGDTSITTLNVTRYQSALIFNSYLLMNGNGQYSNKRVVSPNQMIIGGMGSVRGYPLAEYAGDGGYRGSLEYVLPFWWKIPTGFGEQYTLDKLLSFVAFIDHGKVFIKNKQVGERNPAITGAGQGIILNFPKTSRWIPSASFAAYYASPQFGGPTTSDQSNGTFYLSGLISFY